MKATENKFLAYLADYASYHQTRGNQITHCIGIPLLTATIAGLLAHVQFGPSFAGGLMGLDLGLVAWLLASIWYLSMDLRIGAQATAIGVVLYIIGRAMPLPLLLVCFVVGWIIQYFGHIYYEKNRPAFYKNFEHLLIGPVWVIGKMLHLLPPLPEPARP